MISLRPLGVKASTAQASLRFDLLSNSILFIRSGSYYERNESVQVQTSTLLKSIAATEFCSITIAPNLPIKADGMLSFVRAEGAQVLFSLVRTDVLLLYTVFVVVQEVSAAC